MISVPLACEKCDGDGSTLEAPNCHHSSPCPCAEVEVECEACQGTGVRPCEVGACEERAVDVVDDVGHGTTRFVLAVCVVHRAIAKGGAGARAEKPEPPRARQKSGGIRGSAHSVS